MFSLRHLRFVLCSLDLDVQRAQRIMGFFNYPQINEVGKSDHVAGREDGDGMAICQSLLH